MSPEEKPLVSYEKPALSFADQADRLISRGLRADRNQLMERLNAVNYYRLTGYLYPFRKKNANGKTMDEFEEGTSLETVWDRYCFDRRLRILILDAIERIEVSIRTKLVHKFSMKFGPFGYCQHENLPKLSNQKYLEWRLCLEQETVRSKEAFVKHFFHQYGHAHKQLPLWMVCELMTLGTLQTFFNTVDDDLIKSIANEYGITDEVLKSWVRSLFAVRNICAHHARLWNRKLGVAPSLPKSNKSRNWPDRFHLIHDRSGTILLICRYFLRLISPSSCWHVRVENLFEEYHQVPIAEMGLQEDWRTHPVWTDRTPLEIIRYHEQGSI